MAASLQDPTPEPGHLHRNFPKNYREAIRSALSIQPISIRSVEEPKIIEFEQIDSHKAMILLYKQERNVTEMEIRL